MSGVDLVKRQCLPRIIRVGFVAGGGVAGPGARCSRRVRDVPAGLVGDGPVWAVNVAQVGGCVVYFMFCVY